MKAFVISLPTAAARRERISLQLERAGLPFAVIDALSGAEIAPDLERYCRTLYSPRFNYDMTLNEVACCISHGRALEAFLSSREDHGLILEDDATVPPGVADMIASLLPPIFDIFKVGGIGEAAAPSARTRVLRTNKPTMGAHAYVVSRRGARKLLSRLTPVTVQYDSYLRHVYEHDSVVYETVPHLIGADDGGVSHIGDRAKAAQPQGLHNRLLSLKWQLRHNVLNLLYKLRHGPETIEES